MDTDKSINRSALVTTPSPAMKSLICDLLIPAMIEEFLTGLIPKMTRATGPKDSIELEPVEPEIQQ